MGAAPGAGTVGAPGRSADVVTPPPGPRRGRPTPAPAGATQARPRSFRAPGRRAPAPTPTAGRGRTHVRPGADAGPCRRATAGRGPRTAAGRDRSFGTRGG